jgi:glutaryl-CoA dehydrogenase
MVAPVKELQELTGFDFYNLDAHLTDKQRALRDQVRQWVNDRVLPEINPYWERAEFPRELAMSIKELPIIGGSLTEYGASALDPIEVGLVAYELAKGDGSIGTFYGVHSGLAMSTIGMLGSDEQRARWMPDMVTLDKIGAFGLTEPYVGSNAGGIQSKAKLDGDAITFSTVRNVG